MLSDFLTQPAALLGAVLLIALLVRIARAVAGLIIFAVVAVVLAYRLGVSHDLPGFDW